nr:type II secretion system protein GspL [Legionella sp. PL877]
MDNQNQIIAPLAQRDFDSIKSLQKGHQTIIVLPTLLFSLHRIALPWLNDKKARAAIPFALEENLAQNVNTLHFAFDRNYYQDGHYLVIVGNKSELEKLIIQLNEQAIYFDAITIDWFALNQDEIAGMDSYLLINDTNFQGALSPELATLYFKKLPLASNYSFLVFPNSNKAFTVTQPVRSIKSEEDSFIWLARRLQKIKPMNLCQGELRHGGDTKAKRWYQAAAIMTVIWLATFIGGNLTKLHHLNKEIKEVDAKVAHIYHAFFPQAQQVISPKFRISQLLKSRQTEKDNSFWLLLNILAENFNPDTMNFEQLRFQNQSLQLTLTTKNFAELELFQNRLQKANIQVRQTQASTDRERVVGTLELTL